MMDTPTSFGLWLRQRRRTLDLTQEELARCAGCSVSAIRKIEADERRPSRQVAELLAECLEIILEDRPTFFKIARADQRVDRLGELSLAPQSSQPSVLLFPSPPAPRLKLPTPPTPLVGRTHELASLAQLLQDSSCRLVTLTGPGGSGKTRLAIAAAAERSETFPDGIFFVSLAPLNAAELIVTAIAQAIGFVFYGPTDPKLQLLNYLYGKEMLLVLDNLEHLLEGVGLLSEMLHSTPRVKLLATSRERLSLQGEWVVDLQGLPVPPAGQTEYLESYSAISLFVERAQRLRSGFTIAERNQVDVALICRLVEGMPLGIELAASWIPTLSCREIAQQIEQNIDFLTVSMRDLPERHRSIKAVFEHSWKLLALKEQHVLQRLSVFRGGFTREAAEQVAGASLGVLSTLRAKSLLRRMEAGRYDLHELLRQYAAEKLRGDAEELAATCDRHSAYYTWLLQQREQPLKSAQQQEVIKELEAEIDNIRQAWDWAIAHRQAAKIGQSVECLAWLYDFRGGNLEAAALFGQAIEKLRGPGEKLEDLDAEQSIALGRLLVKQGFSSAVLLGQFEQASHALEQSVVLLRPFNDQIALADALNFLGLMVYFTGNYGMARSVAQESLELGRAIGNQWTVTHSLNLLGIVAQAMGEYQEAYHLFHESLVISRRLGGPRAITWCLNYFSLVAHALGQHTEAQQLLRESIEISRAIGYRWSIATALNHLGLVALSQGDAERMEAQELLRESVTLFQELGERWSMTRALINLGNVSLTLDDHAEAWRSFLEALKTAISGQFTPSALDALMGIATLQTRRGRPQEALGWLMHILNHTASSQETKDRAEQLRPELEAQLTLQQIEATQVRAQSKSFEADVQELLSHN